MNFTLSYRLCAHFNPKYLIDLAKINELKPGTVCMDRFIMISNATQHYESPTCPMADIVILDNCTPNFIEGALTHFKYPILKLVYMDTNPKSTKFLADLFSNNHVPRVYTTGEFMGDLIPKDPSIFQIPSQEYKKLVSELKLTRPTFY